MNRLALLPSLLALALRLVPGPRIVDDAYITFRYARNLAAGNGLVFNAGEMVLGTTTPLFTSLLAGLSLLFRTEDLPRLAWLLNALLDAVGVALAYWRGSKVLKKREPTTVALGAAFLWAIAPFSVTFAIGGLETSLVITILLASFALYLDGRDNWTAVALALGVLARPDVLIAATLVFGAMGLRWISAAAASGQRSRLREIMARFPIQPAILFVGILLPWIIFATLTYGSPLPHSVAAKTVAYHLPPEAALVRLLQHFATPFHGHLILGSQWIAVGLITFIALYSIGALHLVRTNQRAWPAVLFPIFYATIYAIANPLIFRWYLSPPLTFYFLGILSGILALSDGVVLALGRRLVGEEWSARFGRSGRWAVIIFVMLALVSLGNAWTLHPPGPPDRLAPRMAWIELETLYQQVAKDLQDELASSGGQLAAGDIGALGWTTGAPILDLVGLVSPQAKAYYPLPDEAYVANYAVSTDYVLDEQPEFIVILEVYGRNSLARSSSFAAAYQLWRSYPTDIYDSTAMQVFELRESSDGRQ